MNVDTFVCDDASKEPKVQNTLKNVSTEDKTYVRREIEFCVDVQKKLRMKVSTIWREKFEQNKKMLENFKEDLNANFKKMTQEVSLPAHKFNKYEDEINKFNSKWYEVLNEMITKITKRASLKRQ